MAKSIACPHPGCGGQMIVRPGTETARMLHCGKCGELYYRIGGITCIGCCFPENTEAADRLLEAPDGQRPKPEIVARIQNLRGKLGLN